MREFFRGWKRKAGVVTLMVACMFAVGWVRSRFVSDSFGFPVGTEIAIACASGWESLVFSPFRGEKIASIPAGMQLGKALDAPDQADDLFSDPGITWSFLRYGFGIGESSDGTEDGIEIDVYAMPYWSIVLPLTATSAWLLLSKPRPAKRPAIETAE
jgi:hypothetical protein